MGHLSLYADFVKIKLKSIVEYPGAFWGFTIAKMMGWAASVIIIFLTIHKFKTINGWGLYEVLLLYSLNVTAYSLAGFFMYHPFTSLSNHIQNGTFDEMLTKPLNPFFYHCAKGFSYGFIGNIIVSMTTMIVAIIKLDMSLKLLDLFFLIIFVSSGALIHCGLFMIFNIPSFWIIKADAFSILKVNIVDFIKFPISIYDGWIQMFLIFIIPVGFINFFPAGYLLGKDQEALIGLNPQVAFITPVVGVSLYLLGYWLFFLGIRNYKSTGS